MIINNDEKLNNRSKDIEDLYSKYPVLEKVDILKDLNEILKI